MTTGRIIIGIIAYLELVVFTFILIYQLIKLYNERRSNQRRDALPYGNE